MHSLCVTAFLTNYVKLPVSTKSQTFTLDKLPEFSPAERPRSQILVCEPNFSDLILVRLLTPVVKASTSELGGTGSGSFCFGK